ncbi:MAG: DNA topoisomerase IB, partial [Bacteroidia bacterium]|nr:DNA topoisomerase IB [Bacteroidia bacterium]
MPEILPPIVMKRSRLKKLANDPVATAKAVRLVYVNSNDDGISRIKAGEKFVYKYEDKVVKNKTDLRRILSLVLPPAWEEVWICILPDGHLQATGKDAMKRKQYRYHPLWNQLRNKTKFYRMLE